MTAKRTLLHVVRALGGFRIARYVTRRRLRILCYHGFQLRDECAFRPQLFMAPGTFASRLDYLARQGFPVLPLPEALARLRDGTLPDGSVAITIDDGFHAVASVAAGMLAAHRFPAMVYLTTYYVERPNPIFRLVVQYMFWKSRASPLDVGALLGGRPGDIRNLADTAARDAAMEALMDHGERNCDEPGRVDLLRRLGRELGVDYDDIVESRILTLMTPQEARDMLEKGIDVQLHTHRHRFPPDNEKVARSEIVDNRAALSRILGEQHTATHFCYPSGLWVAHQWQWLRDLGVHTATTCLPGLTTAESPPLGLRRFLDGENISQIEFEAELCGFLELMRNARPSRPT
jgi:peptidoglycan/xylan/chitin deacetylase (PgdA/CDA1 family)